MIALVRYDLSMLVRSQSYIAPIVLYGSAIVVLTTNDQGPLTQTYSACVLTLFVSMLWLTAAVLNTEERAQRAMTVVAAGGERRVLGANLLACLLICVLLTVIGLIYPVYAGKHTIITGTDLAVGMVSQLAGGITGIAAGLLCSRIVVRRAGYAVFLALGLMGALLLIRQVPPVATTMVVLGSDRTAAEKLPPVVGYLVIGVVLLAATTYATYLAAKRQE
jgi:hypothetical protein